MRLGKAEVDGPNFLTEFPVKQTLQNLNSGATLLEEVTSPCARPGQLLIRTAATLVSVDTERMLVHFGRANLIDKARQQPDKVRMVLDKVKTDGLMPTLDAVRSKLDQPLPMGYCNVGVVLEVGAGDGRLTFPFDADAAGWVALDPDVDELRRAAQAAPAHGSGSARFMQGDARRLPFAAGGFDIVFFSHALC